MAIDFDKLPVLPTGDAARALSASAIAEHINAQRGGLVELHKRLEDGHITDGEWRQNIDRRVTEATEQLRNAKAAAALEGLQVHAGLPEGEVIERYGAPGPSFRLTAVKRTIKLPSGGSETVRVPGYLDDPRPLNAAQVNAQRAWRALALAGSVQKRRGASVSVHLMDAAYTATIRALAEAPTARLSPQVRAILDGTAGSGSELLSVPTLADIREPMRLNRRLAGIIETVTHSTDGWKDPVQTGNALMRLRSATTDDPARYARSKFTTSADTRSTYGYTAQCLIDDDLLMNPSAVVRLSDRAMAFLDQQEADTAEVQLLHSDTAGTHQDAIATWTLGGYFTAGELDGADSPVKQAIGWRATAFDDGCDVSAAGSFDESDWFGAIALMGNRALSALQAATGLGVYFAQILPNAKFINRDYVGDNATLLTGQVLRIGGVPLTVSEFMPSDLATTGLYTGSGTAGSIVIGDPTAWCWDEVPAMDSDWEVNEQHRGAVYIGRKRHYRLTKRSVSGEKPNALIRYL